MTEFSSEYPFRPTSKQLCQQNIYIYKQEKNGTENGTENGTGVSTSEKRHGEILRLMKLNKKITYDNLVNTLHVSRRTIARDINILRSQNKLLREGSDYDGNWVIIEY